MADAMVRSADMGDARLGDNPPPLDRPVDCDLVVVACRAECLSVSMCLSNSPDRLLVDDALRTPCGFREGDDRWLSKSRDMLRVDEFRFKLCMGGFLPALKRKPRLLLSLLLSSSLSLSPLSSSLPSSGLPPRSNLNRLVL